jgi:hypothetical protein
VDHGTGRRRCLEQAAGNSFRSSHGHQGARDRSRTHVTRFAACCGRDVRRRALRR